MGKAIELLILCFVFGAISTSTNAGGTKKQIRVGVRGGVNASTTSVSLSGYDPARYIRNNAEYKYSAGFNAGIFVEFPLSGKLSFQPELIFSSKGMMNETFVLYSDIFATGYRTMEIHAVSKITSYYVELPLYVKAGFDLSRSGRLTAGIGPYFACGISGEIHAEYILSESDNPSNAGRLWTGEKNLFEEGELIFENGIPGQSSRTGRIRDPWLRKPLKRFDAGLSGFVGYELWENWSVTATCDFGLTNLLIPAEAWDGEVSGSMYNRTFYVSLGYKF
jgi:hypothetical protein